MLRPARGGRDDNRWELTKAMRIAHDQVSASPPKYVTREHIHTHTHISRPVALRTETIYVPVFEDQKGGNLLNRRRYQSRRAT